jgi:hypothetical protein
MNNLTIRVSNGGAFEQVFDSISVRCSIRQRKEHTIEKLHICVEVVPATATQSSAD